MLFVLPDSDSNGLCVSRSVFASNLYRVNLINYRVDHLIFCDVPSSRASLLNQSQYENVVQILGNSPQPISSDESRQSGSPSQRQFFGMQVQLVELNICKWLLSLSITCCTLSLSDCITLVVCNDPFICLTSGTPSSPTNTLLPHANVSVPQSAHSELPLMR